ncbi:MAG: ferritin family protein, partial [Dehalococcoidia bacterium]
MPLDNPVEILDQAIDREQGGHEFYLKAAQKTQDAKGRHLFQWLAQEELRHFNLFSRQRQSLVEEKQWQEAPPPVPPVDKGSFPPISEATGEVRDSTGEVEALSMAIQAERDSIALYTHGAQEATDPEARKLFSSLAAEEQGHLDLLEAEQEFLRRARTYFTLHR